MKEIKFGDNNELTIRYYLGSEFKSKPENNVEALVRADFKENLTNLYGEMFLDRDGKNSLRNPETFKEYQEWIFGDLNGDYLVAYDNFNNPCGFAFTNRETKGGDLEPFENIVKIEYVGITPYARKKGYATALVKAIEDEYRNDPGVDKIVLTSFATEEARNLYFKLGYVTTECSMSKQPTMEKPSNLKILQEAQFVYELTKQMKAEGKKNVSKYVTNMMDNNNFENLYQYYTVNSKNAKDEYNRVNCKIKRMILNSKSMPILLKLVDTMLNRADYHTISDVNSKLNWYMLTLDYDVNEKVSARVKNVLNWSAKLEKAEKLNTETFGKYKQKTKVANKNSVKPVGTSGIVFGK